MSATPGKSQVTPDEVLGQEALKRGFLKPEQLREALGDQAREVANGRAKPRPLVNILVSKGFLTTEQVIALRGGGDPESKTDAQRLVPKEELARGGMGAILRAEDRDIRRSVAMKVMLDATDEKSVARFLEEAQVTGQLEHPNIVPVHALGKDQQGRPYFTMKLVKGRSLADVLKALRDEPDKAKEYTLPRLLGIFTNVCNAIAFAHSKGVVHRDLKPANVMTGAFGETLVMDWGLAKVGAAKAKTGRWQGADAANQAANQKLEEVVKSLRQETVGSRTLDGALLGTPHYMPPEQGAGEIAKIDARSDVYSLGAILYEILTLKPPVEGKTLQALLKNVVEGNLQAPELRAPQRHISRELSAVAMKALARDQGDRYQAVEDLRRDIELYLEGRAVSAKPDTAWEMLVKLARRNRGVSLTSAVGILTLTLASTFYLRNVARARTEAETQASRARAAEAESKEQESQARRQAEEAVRQSTIAGKARKDAEIRLAEGLVAQGNALRQAARCQDANERYAEALGVFEKVGYPSLAADLALLESYWQAPPPLLSFTGHTDHVNGVAFSSDGKVAISGSADGTIKLWQVGTGREIRSLIGHVGRVNSVVLSSDGQCALSGGGDGTVRLWDIRSGTQLHSNVAHSAEVMGVAFSQDGHLVLSTSSDGTKVWDVASWREVQCYKGAPVFHRNVALSANNQLAFSGNLGTVRLWEVSTGRLVRSLSGHTNFVQSFALSPDGRFVLSGGDDKTLILWDVSTGERIRSFVGHTGAIQYVAISPDNHLGVSASADKTMKLWNLETGLVISSFHGHTAQVMCVAFSPSGEMIISGGQDNSIKIWDIRTRGQSTSPTLRKSFTPGLACSPDGLVAITGDASGCLRLYDLETNQTLRTIEAHTGMIQGVSVSPDGTKVLTGSHDCTMKLWDLETGREIRTFVGTGNPINGVSFSRDGRFAYSGGPGAFVKWDLDTGSLLRSIKQPDNERVFATSFSHDGRLALAMGSEQWNMRLVNLEEGRQLRTFTGHAVGPSGKVWAAAFAPDGSTCLSASHDSTLRLWDVGTGSTLRSFIGHEGSVFGVAFSPNGMLAISGGRDQQLKVWDVTTAREIHSFGIKGEIQRVAFCADGQMVLCLDEDGTLSIWDFSLAKRHRELSAQVRGVQAQVQDQPENALSFIALGEWYAFRSSLDLAIDFFERARALGGKFPAIELGRCYWKKGDLVAAKREFQLALERKEAPEYYLKLCLQAIQREAASTPGKSERK